MRRFGSAQHRIFQADGEDFLFLAGESAIFQLDPVTRALLDGCPKDGLSKRRTGSLPRPFPSRPWSCS